MENFDLSKTDILEWIAERGNELNSRLNSGGAILLRGGRKLTVQDFEQAMMLICPNLWEYNGEHERTSMSKFVSTPTSYPAEEKLLWHSENTFNSTVPTRIFFSCITKPIEGGESPIVDNRRFVSECDQSIIDEFQKKGILYERVYHEGLGRSWDQIYSVSTRSEVESILQRSKVEYEWNGGVLRTRAHRSAVVPHPVTRVSCWIGQPMHWHPDCLDPEIKEMLSTIYSDLPRNCFYGDGTEISSEVINCLRGTYKSLEKVFPWEVGDILLLDNFNFAHARNSYTGDRGLYVCIGDLVEL